MRTTGWPNNVNNHILAETSITTGEGGFVEDSSSNGHKQRRATSLVTPRKYNVTMDFDWGGAGSEFQFPKDENGFTEYDRFQRWFKFIHQKGSVPFWFPCITKESIDDLLPYEKSKMCLYKITSTLNESQSGFSQRITMTWEEVYSGVINIPDVSLNFLSVSGINGKAKLVFDKIPSITPTPIDISISYKKNGGEETPLALNDISGKNNVISVFYNKLESSGSYEIILNYKGTSHSYTLGV